MITRKQAELLTELEAHGFWQGWSYLRIHHSVFTLWWLEAQGFILRAAMKREGRPIIRITKEGVAALDRYCRQFGINKWRVGLHNNRLDEEEAQANAAKSQASSVPG
jgi:hypothetical protein